MTTSGSGDSNVSISPVAARLQGDLHRIRLDDAAREFLDRCHDRNLADSSQGKYRRELRAFCRFCDARGVVYVDQIDRTIIDDYASELSKRLHPNTVRSLEGILMSFTGDLFARREIEIDPMHKYPRPQAEDEPRPFLEHDQAIDILRDIDRTTFDGARLGAYMMTCYHTAVRGGGALALDWGHVDFARKCIYVRIKGGKRRSLPMNEDLEAELRGFRAKWAPGRRSLPTAPVFTARTGNRWKLKYLYPSLRRFGLAGCGSRLLRRSALTHVGDKFTIQTVKSYATHANIASADPYLQAPESHVVAAARHLCAAPPRENERPSDLERPRRRGRRRRRRIRSRGGRRHPQFNRCAVPGPAARRPDRAAGMGRPSP